MIDQTHYVLAFDENGTTYYYHGLAKGKQTSLHEVMAEHFVIMGEFRHTTLVSLATRYTNREFAERVMTELNREHGSRFELREVLATL